MNECKTEDVEDLGDKVTSSADGHDSKSFDPSKQLENYPMIQENTMPVSSIKEISKKKIKLDVRILLNNSLLWLQY